MIPHSVSFINEVYPASVANQSIKEHELSVDYLDRVARRSAASSVSTSLNRSRGDSLDLVSLLLIHIRWIIGIRCIREVEEGLEIPDHSSASAA